MNDPEALPIARRRGLRRGVYLLPSLFTMANMFCGYCCIVYTMRGEFATAAPFIGLFGTVWGIMVSFQAIANSQNTNLAVVAPGIAEALFATAIGLLAAIPATIFYNMFTADAGRIGSRLENFADEFSAIISRQLDERV